MPTFKRPKTDAFSSVLWIATVILLSAKLLSAVPANPRPRLFQQPDGTTFTAVLKGDEHFSFAVDEEGFSIICDPVTGWWSYADKQNGLLVPSGFLVGRDACPFRRGLRPNAEAVASLPQNYNKIINVSPETRHRWSLDFLYGPKGTKENPSKAPSGRRYVNVLLGNFTDSTFAWYSATEKAGNNPYGPFPYDPTASNKHDSANTKRFNFLTMGDSTSPYVPDSSAVGSMTNYYFEFTYRSMCWYGTVDGPRSSGRSRANSVQTSGAPTNLYVTGVLAACDPHVDYDQDNDGVQDNLVIVHPGPGQEESGDTRDIWSMSMTGSFGTRDGVPITKVIVVPQNSQLGVFCHEMFHQIGGPDLYDYGYSSTPWGVWSLMDNGSWNGPVGGDQPAFPGGHLQYDIDGILGNGIDGWLNAAVYTDSISSVRNGDGRYSVSVLDSCGEARRGNITEGKRFWRIRNNSFRDSSQVFFVENRRRTPPYESGLPEDGLIITHVDTRMSGSRLNNGPPTTRYFYSWVESPGFDPNPSYNSGVTGDTVYLRNIYNAAYSVNDWNPGGYFENRIDSLSTPNCRTNRNNAYGPWIYDISAEGPVMSFSVARTGMASSLPLVGFRTCTVLDPTAGSAANNGNGILDPWETDSLKLTFYNAGAAIASGAQCSLYVTEGSQYIAVTPGWKQIGAGSFPVNAEVASQPFVVNISSSAPRFTDITFGVKIKSTNPAYTDTSGFCLRISGLKVVFTYDFQNIRVGGSTYPYRIKPSDLAVYRDTLYVANCNLDVGTFQNRIYKVKKATTNNPLQSSDTLASLNNKGSDGSDATSYIGGIDIDNSGFLLYSIKDSIYQITRAGTRQRRFRMPNVDWSPTGSPMKRGRGVAFGPTVGDTVGPDPWPGDSLLMWWQQYNTDGTGATIAGAALIESVYVSSKPNTGTAVVSRSWAIDDSVWGAGTNGQWWNGRAMENDGSCFWCTSVWQNIIIRKNAYDTKIVEILPGPSSFGSYGTYGLAHEATDASGNPYQPVGATAYAPGQRGTKHYLYCASMDEGKIYKIDVTAFMVPTPPDSVKTTQAGPSANKVKWWKANADTQKIYKYIVYRQLATATAPPSAADSIGYAVRRFGSALVDSFIDNGASKAPGDYKYSVESVNYYGYGGWGASSWAPPLAVELAFFSALAAPQGVVLSWRTESENGSYQWIVERAEGGSGYTELARLPAAGSSSQPRDYDYIDAAAKPNRDYLYRIAELSLEGELTYYGPVSVSTGSMGMPTAFALGNPAPNPFSGRVTISYQLPAASEVSLKVYNILGQAVRELERGRMGPGYYRAAWDGRTDGKGKAAAGVYFVELRARSGEAGFSKRITVLKIN